MTQGSTKIKKAVIPAAGLGTRFLPATKTIPKEMLPIFDIPTILLVIEEALDAGIEDIVLISGRGKNAIEDFFDVSYELEDKIAGTDKVKLLERVQRVRDSANVISIRQKQALGLGHAVYTAKPIVGDEPFAVLLGDEVFLSTSLERNPSYFLANSYAETGVSSVLVMQVAESEVNKYGIAAVESGSGPIYKITDLVEKPPVGEAPSRFALPGRYVFSSDIFSILKDTKPGRGNEIQLTDAMVELAKTKGCNACHIPTDRFDAGDKFGFMQAAITLALKDPKVGPQLKDWMKQL